MGPPSAGCSAANCSTLSYHRLRACMGSFCQPASRSGRSFSVHACVLFLVGNAGGGARRVERLRIQVLCVAWCWGHCCQSTVVDLPSRPSPRRRARALGGGRRPLGASAARLPQVACRAMTGVGGGWVGARARQREAPRGVSIMPPRRLTNARQSVQAGRLATCVYTVQSSHASMHSWQRHGTSLDAALICLCACTAFCPFFWPQ